MGRKYRIYQAWNIKVSSYGFHGWPEIVRLIHNDLFGRLQFDPTKSSQLTLSAEEKNRHLIKVMFEQNN